MGETEWFAELSPRSILMGFRGSQAHGTYRPSTEPDSIDDIDIMAVVVHPLEAYIGLGAQVPPHEAYAGVGVQDTREVVEGPWDVVAYDVRHFVRLLCKNNPNVMSMLWMARNYYQVLTPAGKMLVDAREIFSTKEAYHSFKGYAYSQLHKMTSNAFQGYMGDKRKKLVEKHGYDTKNASHLLRLLRMCIEFLGDGRLRVLREDNTYLVDVKRGALTLKQVQDEATRLLALADEALVQSPLPAQVDQIEAEKLLVKVIQTAHEWQAVSAIAAGGVR